MQIRIPVNYELITAYETPEIHFAEMGVIIRSTASSYVPSMSHLKSVREILNFQVCPLQKNLNVKITMPSLAILCKHRQTVLTLKI